MSRRNCGEKGKHTLVSGNLVRRNQKLTKQHVLIISWKKSALMIVLIYGSFTFKPIFPRFLTIFPCGAGSRNVIQETSMPVKFLKQETALDKQVISSSRTQERKTQLLSFFRVVKTASKSKLLGLTLINDLKREKTLKKFDCNGKQLSFD